MEYVKQEYFKKLGHGDIFCRLRIAPFLGDVETVRSTRDCDTEELTTAIERFRDWASRECGIYLPAPDEQEFLQDIEVRIEQYGKYL